MNKSFFEYIGIADVERIHTQFLAWIFSDDCNAIEPRLRRTLLRQLFGLEREYDINKIYTERKSIDLVIETDGEILIIENKFKSSQHSNQLHRYKLSAEELYPKFKKRYYFLTLIGEPCTDADWQKITYREILQKLDALAFISDTCHNVILQEYLGYLRKLMTVVDDFKENTGSYDMVFLDGKKRKEDKIGCTYKNSNEQFIAANQLETILQKSYLSSVAELMNEREVIITDTRGDALMNFTLANNIVFQGKKYRTIIQMQMFNLKFAFTTDDLKYGSSKKKWIEKVIPFMEKLANTNGYGYSKVNKPKEKAYISLSKKTDGYYWHKPTEELVGYLQAEIKKGEELTSLLVQEIEGAELTGGNLSKQGYV